MDYEKDLEQIAKLYEDEGYVSLTHPETDQLPEFASGFGVDILATRGKERVLVGVKRDRADLAADPDAPRLAEITNAQPGWRYDLIVLHGSDPFQRLTRNAREPSNAEIIDALTYVERLLHTSDVRAACVFAWAALEATMRKLLRNTDLDVPRIPPGELLPILYSNGFLSREEFTTLNHAFSARTALVHGLVPPDIEVAAVQFVVGVIGRLLVDKLGAPSVAG